MPTLPSANPSTREQTRPSPIRIALAGIALALNNVVALAANPLAFLPTNSSQTSTISVVDVTTATRKPSITVMGTDPAGSPDPGFFGVALSPRDGMLYVSDDFFGSVYQINTVTGQTVHKYSVGDNPRGIAVDPSGRHVYVANFGSSSISVIDTSVPAANNVTEVDFDISALIASPDLHVSRFPSPYGLAMNLAGTRAYVSDSTSNQLLCRINAVTPPAKLEPSDCVEVGVPDQGSANANQVAVSPDDTRVYVVNNSDNTISVVDTTSPTRLTVLRTFGLGVDGSGPNGITVSASGKRAYVGTSLGRVIPLDLTRVATGQDPVMPSITVSGVTGVAISPDGTRLLAVDNGGHLNFINIVNDANVLAPNGSVALDSTPYAYGQFTLPDAIFVGGFQR